MRARQCRAPSSQEDTPLSDNPTTDPATDPANAGGATGGDPSSTPPATGQAPNWEGNFDPERAAKLVENLRRERDEARSKLKTREDAEKSDLQKAQERAKELADELAADRKANAAKAYKLPASLAQHLTGSTKAEIEASAKALAEELGIAPDADELPALPGRPKPRLTPGHGTPNDGPAFDPAAVAKAARAAH